MTLFLLGIQAQVTQTALMREGLGTQEGSELILAVALAAWLAGIAVGAGCLPLASTRFRRTTVLVVVALLPCMSILAVRVLGVELRPSPGSLISLRDAMLLVMMSCLIPAIAIGAAFRMLASGPELLAAGRAYAMEAGGAFAGGVLVTFVLADLLPETAWVLGAGALLLVRALPLPPRGATIAAVLLAALAIMAGLHLDGVVERWAWDRLLPGYTLEARKPSRHGMLTVLDHGGGHSLYLGRAYLATEPNRRSNAADAALLVASHPDPQSALILGLATPGYLRALSAFSLESIRVFEPVGFESLRALLDARSIPGVKYISGDPRSLLGSEKGQHSLIDVRWAEPRTLSDNRFHTQEFFSSCAEALADGGVLRIRVPGAVNDTTSDTMARRRLILTTLLSEFGEAVLLPGSTDTYLAAHHSGSLTLDAEQMASRVTGRFAASLDFDPAVFSVLVDAPHAAAVASAAMTGSFVDSLPFALGTAVPRPLTTSDSSFADPRSLNRDFAPRLVRATLMRRASMDGDRSLESLLAYNGFLAVSPGLLCLALLPMALLAWRRRRRPETVGARAIGVFIFGLLGGVSGLLIFWTFQVKIGGLFHDLGLLSAAFMAGAAAGAAASSRLRHAVPLALLVGLLILIALGLLLPFTPEGMSPTLGLIIWSGISLLAGAATGAGFAALADRGDRTDTSAPSWIPLYALDVAGGVLAAVLMFPILVGAMPLGPFLGAILGILLVALVLATVCRRSPAAHP